MEKAVRIGKGLAISLHLWIILGFSFYSLVGVPVEVHTKKELVV